MKTLILIFCLLSLPPVAYASQLFNCPKGTIISFLVENNQGAESDAVGKYLASISDEGETYGESRQQLKDGKQLSTALEGLRNADQDYDDHNWRVDSPVLFTGGYCNSDNGTENDYEVPVYSQGISSAVLAGFLKVRTLGPCDDAKKKDVRVCVLGTSRSLSAYKR